MDHDIANLRMIKEDFYIFSESSDSELDPTEDAAADGNLELASCLSDLCRLCASLAASRPGTRPIFLEPSLAPLIHACLPLKVCADDALPLLVCSSCVTALHTSHSLLTSALQAQQDLTRLLHQEQQILQEQSSGVPRVESEDSPQPDHPRTAPAQEPPTHGDPPSATPQPYSPLQWTLIDCSFMKVEPQLPCEDITSPHSESHLIKVEPSSVELPTLDSFLVPDIKNIPKKPIRKRRKKSKRRLLSRKKSSQVYKKSDKEHIPSNQRTRSENTMYECSLCPRYFDTFTIYFNHMSSRHEIFKCEKCTEFQGSSKEELKSHKTGCLSCKICNQQFPRDQKLQCHVRKHHECDICSKILPNRTNLLRHKKIHKTIQHFTCETCHKNYKTQMSLRAHIKAIHNANRTRSYYVCSFCDAKYKSKPRIMAHLSECSKLDPSVPELYKKVEPFLCEHCTKGFSCRRSIILHLKLVHDLKTWGENREMIIRYGEPKFMCDKCGKKFRYTAQLKMHLNTHTKNKDFPCTSCDKSFPTQTLLDNHVRLHTGATPYKCTTCQLRFRTYKMLMTHRVDHLENRPHQCSFCGRGCKNRARLIEHERIHTGERPYRCLLCGYASKQRSDMFKHMRSMHKEQIDIPKGFIFMDTSNINKK